MKKIVVLIIILGFIVFPSIIKAEPVISGECGNNASWTLNEKTLIISGSGEIENSQSWLEYKSIIEHIVINEGITEIGYYAFSDFQSVLDISLPSSLRSIGEYAFHTCSKLTSISIPENVMEIHSQAFRWCYALESINVVNSNNWFCSYDGVLFNKDKTILVTCPIAKSSPYTVPNGVNTIETGAFEECNISEVIIPDSVKHIGESAFLGCMNLSKVRLSNNLTVIEPYTFQVCPKLLQIELPDSIESIEHEAFTGCGLQYVRFSANLKSIGSSAFEMCDNLAVLNLPLSLEKIDSSAFVLCSHIKAITIPDHITVVERETFAHCYDLQYVSIPAETTEIREVALDNCSDLKSMYVWGKDTVIDENVFGYYSDPSNLVIYCYSGSKAETFAYEHGYNYSLLDDNTEIGSLLMPETEHVSIQRTIPINAMVCLSSLNYTIEWESLDPQIATVDQTGLVTPVSVGNTYIRASVNGKSSMTKLFVEPVAQQLFAPEEVFVVLREYESYSITQYPENAIVDLVYDTSGDTEIAHISGDEDYPLVTHIDGKKLGTAVRKYTDIISGISGSTKIIVCKPVSAVSFENETVEVPLRGEKQLIAHVSMDNQSCVNQLVTFYSDDSSVAVVDKETGLVTAVNEGTTIITARSDNNISATCTVHVRKPKMIRIPSGTIRIESGAFAGDTSVEAVYIPSSVKEIDEDAFNGCGPLIFISEPNGVAENYAKNHGDISFINEKEYNLGF